MQQLQHGAQVNRLVDRPPPLIIQHGQRVLKQAEELHVIRQPHLIPVSQLVSQLVNLQLLRGLQHGQRVIQRLSLLHMRLPLHGQLHKLPLFRRNVLRRHRGLQLGKHHGQLVIVHHLVR